MTKEEGLITLQQLDKRWCKTHERVADHIDKDGNATCDPSLRYAISCVDVVPLYIISESK